MTGIGPEPRHARQVAIQADRRAGDRIAVAMDELLVDARLMRRVGARLLTRGISRSTSSTARAIAGELRVSVRALGAQIYRAGGASFRCFRREIILCRLAAIVEQPRIPWPIAAEVLGAPRTQTVIALVRIHTGLSAGLWREQATAAGQLTLFRSFLVMNAVAWSLVTERSGPGVMDAAKVRTAEGLAIALHHLPAPVVRPCCGDHGGPAAGDCLEWGCRNLRTPKGIA